jgi:hypothetical protein
MLSVMLIDPTEASRAKHKFAVKRNSWPKTRGVAMNPVDHVRIFQASPLTRSNMLTATSSPTEEEIINISERHPQSLDTLLKVKKPVLLLQGELVYYVVLKRQRIRCWWKDSKIYISGAGIISITHYTSTS